MNSYYEKLTTAVDYLRRRNIYTLDAGNNFRYVPAHATSVQATVQRFHEETLPQDPHPFDDDIPF